MTIGEHIRQEREKAGLTQAQLGEFLGLSQAAISMYEKGQRTPDMLFLRKISDFFHVSLDYMTDHSVGGSDEFTASVPDRSDEMPAGQALTTKSNKECDLLTTFRLLDSDNQVILLGEAKKALRDQRREKLTVIGYRAKD